MEKTSKSTITTDPLRMDGDNDNVHTYDDDSEEIPDIEQMLRESINKPPCERCARLDELCCRKPTGNSCRNCDLGHFGCSLVSVPSNNITKIRGDTRSDEVCTHEWARPNH